MFKCRVCLEKNSRITDLKAEILYLRSMVLPQNDAYTQPIILREADATLSNTGESIDVGPEQEEELRKYQEMTAEKDRILSGNY